MNWKCRLGARTEPAGLEACRVRVSVQAASQTSPELRSSPKKAQTTWDDLMSPEGCAADLTERVASLLGQLGRFREKRSSNMEVLILGAQHHGKSSFINHVYRCLLA